MHVKHGHPVEGTPNFTQLNQEIWTVQVELHGCTMHRQYQTLYCPTNAHKL